MSGNVNQQCTWYCRISSSNKLKLMEQFWIKMARQGQPMKHWWILSSNDIGKCLQTIWSIIIKCVVLQVPSKLCHLCLDMLQSKQNQWTTWGKVLSWEYRSPQKQNSRPSSTPTIPTAFVVGMVGVVALAIASVALANLRYINALNNNNNNTITAFLSLGLGNTS